MMMASMMMVMMRVIIVMMVKGAAGSAAIPAVKMICNKTMRIIVIMTWVMKIVMIQVMMLMNHFYYALTWKP